MPEARYDGAMHAAPTVLRTRVEQALYGRGIARPDEIAWACAWLQACGYPGVKLLLESLGDEQRDVPLTRDGLGIDLRNISCVWLAPKLMRDVADNGRVFLRNVRHGLYLVPFTVRNNIAIGCPVDPAFALGGERAKNPYEEKLALAEQHGIDVPDADWAALAAA